MAKQKSAARRARPSIGRAAPKKTPKKKKVVKKTAANKVRKKTKTKQQRVVKRFGEETMSFGAKKNSKKNPKKKGPPRPPSAYNLFMKKELPGWKKLHPKATQKEAFAGVAKMWSAEKKKRLNR